MSGFDPFGSLPGANGLSDAEADALKEVLVSEVAELKVKVPNVPDVTDVVLGSSLPRYERNRPAPPLEVYVADHVREAERLVADGLKDPRQFTEITPGDDRVGRAEKYARWRWHGYKDGEIASL